MIIDTESSKKKLRDKYKTLTDQCKNIHGRVNNMKYKNELRQIQRIIDSPSRRKNMIDHHKFVSRHVSKKPTPYASWSLREYENVPVPPKPKCKIINSFLEDVQQNGRQNQYESKRKQLLQDQDKEMLEKLDEKIMSENNDW